MNELAWLVGHRFQSLTRREYDWLVVFDKDASMTVACLWRMVESDRIRFTSEDNGHQFGLSTLVDSAAEINRRLEGATVERVDLRQNLLDVELRFDTGHNFQIILTSSGYEAWSASDGNRRLIAVGGGELAIIGGD
ncbi:hypothetical protein [Zavarzinella formosa]|uniref:hypothetical protein n=1 Tax=Zavarzinella formosa TaxID=360055 RepID=UPI0002D367A9|nr:hypothetical protein [Zavarzinella formosa]